MRLPRTALAVTTSALVLTTALLTAPIAGADEPGTDDLRLLNLNFAGNGFNGGDTGAPVDALIDTITAEQPEIIALQEVCLTQWLAIEERLSAQPGYEELHGSWAVTNYAVPNCTDPEVDPDGRYVIGAFSRHASEPVYFGDEPFLDLGYHYMVSSIPRYRKLVCIDAAVPTADQDVRACSIHPEVPAPRIDEETFPHVPDIRDDPNYGRTINEVQVETIARAANPWVRERPVALMGDFNTVPWHPTLDPIYRHCLGRGSFVEIDAHDPRFSGEVKRWDAGPFWPEFVDGCSLRKGDWTFGEEGLPDDPTNPFASNRKIDFIFLDNRHFEVDEDSGDVRTTFASDHRYVLGSVSLP